jgi:hypothetical protein
MAANTFLVRSPGAATLAAGATRLVGNILRLGGGSAEKSGGAKNLCIDFGGLQSLGGNLANDPSCNLFEQGDLVTQSLGLLPADADGTVGLAPNSPAIDRGPGGTVLVAFPDKVRPLLPCGYRDIRGLGRPQDGKGDGQFRCDSGAWELQGGPDIGPAQTGIFFDPARNGEGHFVELFGDGKALISTFTYGMNGGMAWFLGVGEVVGNSVVVDEMIATTGGRFGAAFDPEAIVRERVGGASLVFPDCEAGAKPGHWAFQADQLLDAYEDVSARAVRLGSVVPCAGAPGALAHRSGTYYAPERSGEGIVVHYLPDGRAVLVFYSYTPQGQPFWAISGETTVQGNTLTAAMHFPSATTRFGRGFNAGQVSLAPWGTVTLTHTGCNTATFAYQSSMSGYGSGSHAYERLTQPAGTACPD